MLLLPDSRHEERRAAVRRDGPLAPLADSLEAELAPWLDARIEIPSQKALLSRAGGRCEVDGSTLEFDPTSAHAHRCPQCGRVYRGELHDRAWVMPFQLWLAERTVHAALFHALRGDARHAAFARSILRAYADRYLQYPNVDNVLGPTRLFFSTYLESIWLLQVCIACDLVDRSGDHETAELVRDRIIVPSRSLIAEYDEGMSNRQVWHNAALLAAAATLGEADAFDERIHAPSGLLAHLAQALLQDGTWYEGENYHQFALRGLWYGVTMLEARGGRLPPDREDRLRRAFAAPILTALPDFTMPSRKDSQYAVSLRQWRMAELLELGYARHRDDVLEGALARCYEDTAGLPRSESGRARSTADVERNGPASLLTRADLGWRALLHARPELPRLHRCDPRSAHLEAQGYAVFRRDGDVYVGVDYGQSGGGHGHPDRLNLTLYQGTRRWLDDMGTASYVDPSLHWYRSTLAHNAPLVNGVSQPLSDGTLVAYDEREGMGWIVASFAMPQSRVTLERTIVVAPDYLLDELRWMADEDVRVELPWHLDGATANAMTPGILGGGQRPDDGFAYVTDVRHAAPSPPPVQLTTTGPLSATVLAGSATQLLSACGPGQPPSTLRRFHVIRSTGARGFFQTLVSWSPGVSEATRPDAEGAIVVRHESGERHVHRRDERGWHVELFAGGARSSIDLAGFRAPAPAPRSGTRAGQPVPMRIHRTDQLKGWLSETPAGARSRLLTYELGEAHYRRSEESWSEAGSPHAMVAIGATPEAIVILADISAGDPVFAPADASNPFDNEHPDTMRAGVQLYARFDGESGAWMIVPEPAGGTRVRTIRQSDDVPAPRARWRPTASGYELRVELELPRRATVAPFSAALDVVINETTSARVRRRGQLVLSGARGEFVYLRGDRQADDRLVPMLIVP